VLARAPFFLFFSFVCQKPEFGRMQASGKRKRGRELRLRHPLAGLLSAALPAGFLMSLVEVIASMAWRGPREFVSAVGGDGLDFYHQPTSILQLPNCATNGILTKTGGFRWRGQREGIIIPHLSMFVGADETRLVYADKSPFGQNWSVTICKKPQPPEWRKSPDEQEEIIALPCSMRSVSVCLFDQSRRKFALSPAISITVEFYYILGTELLVTTSHGEVVLQRALPSAGMVVAGIVHRDTLYVVLRDGDCIQCFSTIVPDCVSWMLLFSSCHRDGWMTQRYALQVLDDWMLVLVADVRAWDNGRALDKTSFNFYALSDLQLFDSCSLPVPAVLLSDGRIACLAHTPPSLLWSDS
jgi:hypothetical protein